MLENIRLAFQGVWSHKMRSMLTMLGIIIGIAAIITIVSTIKGTNEQIKENLIGAGNNVVTVQLNENGYPFDASWNDIPSCVRPITEQTRQELEQLDGAQRVSLFYSRNYADGVFYQDNQYNGSIYGVDENYLGAYGYQVKLGRGFTKGDYQNFRKVVLVDDNAISALSLGQNPVGQVLEEHTRPDGLNIQKISVPMGVIAIIYESRPNVTSDAAALALKSGNVCILRGGKYGFRLHLTDIFGNFLSGADADISAGFQIIHREDQFPCLVVKQMLGAGRAVQADLNGVHAAAVKFRDAHQPARGGILQLQPLQRRDRGFLRDALCHVCNGGVKRLSVTSKF